MAPRVKVPNTERSIKAAIIPVYPAVLAAYGWFLSRRRSNLDQGKNLP
jgi:hypothetical protein